MLDGIRAGRPIAPLVTYNTWFAYGTEIDEASMRAEMERAAALGVELFVIDAGWYAGAGAAGRSISMPGLGSWTADPARFPNGLAPLRDYAHALGMQVRPLGRARARQPVARRRGRRRRGVARDATAASTDPITRRRSACASGRARQWLMDRLTALIDDVQPDYLKWDNNMLVNCDRDGHGHGATDGNFAHVRALYEHAVRSCATRYPDLLIENVSGGGNRLDVGMLRYTDVAWMDDRTAPSVHVRHNIEGLSAVFPPAYLLSFVTDHDAEPLHDAPDLSLYFRSRMVGALGLCFRDRRDSPRARTRACAHEIDDLQGDARRRVSAAAAALLTRAGRRQPTGRRGTSCRRAGPGNDQVLLSAVQSDQRRATRSTSSRPAWTNRPCTRCNRWTPACSVPRPARP